MKYIFLTVLLLIGRILYAQTPLDTLQKPRFFVASGMGFGFPMGDLKDVMYPKYSTSLGVTIPFKKERVFIYPLVDFLSLGYNQDRPQEGYPYTLEKGTAKIYSLSVMPGVNRFLGATNIYTFLGPSLQLVYEPRIKVDIVEENAKIEKMHYFATGIRGGLGAHYKIGGFYLFAETGWLHSFHQIQKRNVNILTVHGGLKTNITGLANKVIAFF